MCAMGNSILPISTCFDDSYTAFSAPCCRVLHPAFEEDEILLIFVGGVLGLCAGAIQVLAFYS